MDGEIADASHMAELMHTGTVQYSFSDGRLVTNIAGTPVNIAIYELDGSYVAVKDDEFGYANYDVEFKSH
jgi:hypothetical protein